MFFFFSPYELGMPYPQNVETAKSVESIIREQGAIPATIAVLDGKVHIGKAKKQNKRQRSIHLGW
jgi:pseudouridine-5'-phosphate glycosidase